MSRWEPNARTRLERAAMDLFRERGFDQTTVAEIAERAGLTERTFFRYFTDKREVLFSGASALEELFVTSIKNAPTNTTPVDVVASALEATAPMFEERRTFARQRHALITTHADLHERELIKLSKLAAAIATTLHKDRGIPNPTASLIAETAIGVFKIAFTQWVEDKKSRPLTHHIRESLLALKSSLGV